MSWDLYYLIKDVRRGKSTHTSRAQNVTPLRFIRRNSLPIHQSQNGRNHSLPLYYCIDIGAFKRAIAPINPFAYQQVSTTDSVALGDKFGERWWAPDVLLSWISLTQAESPRRTTTPVITTPSRIPDMFSPMEPKWFLLCPKSPSRTSPVIVPELWILTKPAWLLMTTIRTNALTKAMISYRSVLHGPSIRWKTTTLSWWSLRLRPTINWRALWKYPTTTGEKLLPTSLRELGLTEKDQSWDLTQCGLMIGSLISPRKKSTRLNRESEREISLRELCHHQELTSNLTIVTTRPLQPNCLCTLDDHINKHDILFKTIFNLHNHSSYGTILKGPFSLKWSIAV